MRKMISGLAASFVIATAGVALAQAPDANPLLPQGPGRDRVIAVCTSCHVSRTFAQIRENARGWRNQVSEMMLIGAQVSPDDMETIVGYLSTHLGPGTRLPGPPPTPVTLPDGEGKVLVQGACGFCHGLDRVAGGKRSPREWNAIVERMAFYGAPVGEDQGRTIVAYLNQNFAAR